MLRILSTATVLAFSASLAHAACGGHVTAQSTPVTETAQLDTTATASIPPVKKDGETAVPADETKAE